MTAKSETAQSLLAILSWQQQMGIDETLVDDPDSAATLTLRDFDPARPQTATAPDVPTATLPATSPVVTPATSPVASPVSPSGALAEIPSIEALKKALLGFDQCALKHTASNIVFCDGNPGARLMVVSDVPGREEDRVGLPLVWALPASCLTACWSASG